MKKLVFKLRSYIDYLLWKISSSKYLNGSENIRDYQLKKINEQLENAFNNNELYKKYYFECGIQPDFKLHTLEDIKKLPILK